MMIHSFTERSSARFGAILQKSVRPGRGRSFILKALLFAFVLLLLPLPRMAAYAAEGTCGDACTWTLNEEGLLTINGSGPMNDRGWYDHHEEIKKVVIEDGITTIGDSAFESCVYLKAVSIPASVGSIGNYAFDLCVNLTDIIIERSWGELFIGSFVFGFIMTKEAKLRCPEGYTASYSITPVTDDPRIEENTLKWDDEAFPYSFTLSTDLRANTYPLTISAGEHGSVTASVNDAAVSSGDSVAFNDTVTLSVVPENGYGLESLTVKKGEDPVTVTEDDTFTMPMGAVTVTASFKLHEHEYSYSADGAELTVVCANTDRGHVGDSTAVLTLSGPEDLTYDGEAKEASLEGEIPDVETPAIAYKKGSDAVGQPPVDAGTYTAEITLGDATASLEFTIAPKPLSEVMVALDPEGPFSYDGEEHSVTVTASDGDKVLTESVDYEIAEGSVLSAVDTGTYEVIVEGVPVTESGEPEVKALSEGNYSGTVTLTWQITDGEQQPEPEPEPEPEPRRRLFRFCEDCELPATGFSTLRPTALSEQPAALRYEPARMRLMLPTLDRDVELVTVPRQGSSWAAGWLGENAGILEGTAFPGEGTAVIAAHNTLNDTQYGPFAMLASMEAGDRIFVAGEDGSLLSFEVYANEKIAAADLDSLEQIAGSYENSLTLMTCEDEMPEGGYASRRIVAAREK